VVTQDSCYFNGHSAAIVSVNDTVMVVRVPVGAGTGAVSVETGGKTAVGPVFTYQTSVSEAVFAGNGNFNDVNGQGTSASFFYPTGLALAPNGTLFVAEAGGAIRMVSPSGQVTTYPITFNGSVNPASPFVSLTPKDIMALSIDTTNNQLWVGDAAWSEVASFSSQGNPLALRLSWAVSGPGSIYNLSTFSFTTGVTATGGEVWVADYGANYVQLIDPAENKQVYADTNAMYNGPAAVAVDGNKNLYIANALGNNILKRDSNGNVTVFAGSGTKGTADGTGTAASFWGPQGLAIDANGNLYVADSYNQKVRMITPAGVVTSFPFQFSYPIGLAVDPGGTALYVADAVSNVIDKISFN
jgi:DNA-binding beta-propeller fold protein YncE